MTDTYVQDSLVDMAPLVKAEGATIQERWEHWISVNAWVLRSLEAKTEAWLAKGHKRVSTKMLFESIRYEFGVTVGEGWKINNDYSSRASRLLIERHPEWEQYFETRELRAL
jgi:hypothetical protein